MQDATDKLKAFADSNGMMFHSMLSSASELGRAPGSALLGQDAKRQRGLEYGVNWVINHAATFLGHALWKA